MLDDEFLTIEKPSEGLFKDRGSKFFAFAYPVQTEEEIKHIQSELRKKYHDARHHCYAYRLGTDKSVFRANDDGEPSSTAGKPILGQIDSKNLTNVLIVVIRYFGGILLGTGGLINAYRSAAHEALQNAKIISRTENRPIQVTFGYAQTSDVMKLITDFQAEQTHATYDELCHLVITIRKGRSKVLLEKLSEICKAEFLN